MEKKQKYTLLKCTQTKLCTSTKAQPWKHTYCLFTHFFLHPVVFFPFIQTMRPLHSPITTANHKYKSRGHVRKDNGKSKLNLLFVHIRAAKGSSEVE